MVHGFRDEKDAALKKVAEAEERLKETENEKEKTSTKLLNLRKNAGKLLRVIQEVGWITQFALFTNRGLYTPETSVWMVVLRWLLSIALRIPTVHDFRVVSAET